MVPTLNPKPKLRDVLIALGFDVYTFGQVRCRGIGRLTNKKKQSISFRLTGLL